ncbi:SIS domain-containing protein [Lacticaseibacillus parakribbianus]|uniref:SIS domain-containing protein n=1 Tax=Lacticaseibacillus parakribbianus TaxID=2970927 RepID=UPI0021CB7602|nr:sugar isomerase [Lacticaseibacillus parakribbianus]
MSNPTMLTYIQKEQAAMQRILAAYPTAQNKALAEIPLGDAPWLMLGIGSSYNAALSAKHYMETQAGVRIALAQPYNYLHYERVDPALRVVLGVSQSGQSTATIAALKRFNRETFTIGVTSAPGKALSLATDTTLDIGIGHERVGYVTLGFTATVLNLMLLGLRFGALRGRIDAVYEAQELAEFRTLAAQLDGIVTTTTGFFCVHASDFKAATQLTGIAYGPAVGTIKELETKFTETVRIPSDGQELEAFMHGPYLGINPTHRLLFIQSPAEPAVAAKAQALRAYEQKCTPHVFTLNFATPEYAGQTLNLGPVQDEDKVPFIAATAVQTLAWLTTQAKGIDLAVQIFTDFADQVHSKTEHQNYV